MKKLIGKKIYNGNEILFVPENSDAEFSIKTDDGVYSVIISGRWTRITSSIVDFFCRKIGAVETSCNKTKNEYVTTIEILDDGLFPIISIKIYSENPLTISCLEKQE